MADAWNSARMVVGEEGNFTIALDLLSLVFFLLLPF